MRVHTVRELGGLVRDRREKLGLTQSEVAARASVTREWLVRFENGKATMPMTRVFDVLGALSLTRWTRPMPDKELATYLDGVRVGPVRQARQGNTTFVYDDEYRRQLDATPLSLSMPLTQEHHPSCMVMPFLQGLLPDNEARLARLATEFRTSTNVFALLTHVGRDAAGAVQLLPPGENADDAAAQIGDVEKLSDEEFAARVHDVVEHPESWGVRSGAEDHWSLPGAQPKLALFRFDDGSWGVPRGSTPTTHILKPAVPPFADHDVEVLRRPVESTVTIDRLCYPRPS